MIYKLNKLLVCILIQFISFNEGKKLLFTPGPVTTSDAVKEAMTHDEGLTESSAIENMAYIRKSLLQIDNLSEDLYTVIPVQGSSSSAIEAALHTATPVGGKVLLLNNGFFEDALENICNKSGIEFDALLWPGGSNMDISRVEAKLKESPGKYSTIAMIHHETSFGILNPVLEIGKLIKRYNPGAALIVDAVSSFGCYPVPMEEAGIAFMIAAPNKCLESFAGLGVLIARKEFIIKGKENYRTDVLDLFAEYEKLEKSSSSRFTWPLQVYSAFAKGISLFLEEGRENRLKRYATNNEIIRQGMRDFKFQEYYHENVTRTVILTVYKWPTNDAFNFTYFTRALESEGMVIYASSLSKIQVFRIGNIGQLTADDCKLFLAAVGRILKVMHVDNPNPK